MPIKLPNLDDRKYPDLGLIVDEVIARYLRQIADGPECVAYLRTCRWPMRDPYAVGFQSWCEMWWSLHKQQTTDRFGVAGRRSLEWDSRNYNEDEMRAIYEGIILHASRAEVPS